MMQELTLQEIRKIYDTHMQADFPSAEVKPFASIEAMWERGEYMGLAERKDGALLAYAFLVLCRRPEPAVLLDYFAVVREHRGKGVGSAVLSQLAARFPGRPFLLESENPDMAIDEADRNRRERRLAFYGRNRAVDTGVRSRLFGVEYVILRLPTEEDAEGSRSSRQDLENIYHTMFREDQLGRRVVIHPESMEKCREETGGC